MGKASASFETEVSSAVEWLVDTLLPSESPHRAAFTGALKTALEERFTGHWYPDEAHRGCGYRSLTCNGQLDPVIERARASCSLDRQHLLEDRCFMMWVNPGEVKVSDGGAKRYIYCAAGCTPNPYSKPKVRVEPTRLNVSTSESDRSRTTSQAHSSSASPAASPPGTPTGSPPGTPPATRKASPALSPVLAPKPPKAALSPAAANFVPMTAPLSSSQSDSDSEGEPVAAPRAPAPAMAFAPPPMPPPPGLFMSGWPPMPPPHPQHPGGWFAAPNGVAPGWAPAAPYNPYANNTVEAH